MRLRRILPLFLLLAPVTGCYYAVIDTGRPQSVRTVQEGWAHGYAGGMVPPQLGPIVERCPHGAARVEAHRSASNLIVTVLSLGIYAPSTVHVTCALEQRGKATAPRLRAD